VSWFVVSLHDVAPRTYFASKKWFDLLSRRGCRTSMLVVPGPWGEGPHLGEQSNGSQQLVPWLRRQQDSGHEIVLHGWSHTETRAGQDGSGRLRTRVGRLAARGAGEFWQLDEAEARTRLQRGREVFDSLGLCASGFVAPGWLLSDGSMSALRAEGFGHTSTHLSLYDRALGERYSVPALSQRPKSALTSSAATLTLATAALHRKVGRPFRLAVHPDDICATDARTAVLAIADAALAAGYRSYTYDQRIREAARQATRPTYDSLGLVRENLCTLSN
jgi:uncharacterized protein